MTDDRSIKEYDGVSTVDPLVMLKYVGKVVEISTSHGNVIKGTVVTVDPITESYSLVISDEEHMKMTIVLGSSVKSVAFVDEIPISFNFKCSAKTAEQNCESMDETRKRLKDWLEKNMIPIEEENDVLKLDDTLFIHPPYRVENVLSSNEMVLNRILGIMEKMPTT